jgi:peptide deformylase
MKLVCENDVPISPLCDDQIVAKAKELKSTYLRVGRVPVLGRDVADVDNVLHHSSVDVQPEFYDLAARMGVVLRDVIKGNRGDLGVAAPQIGLPWRLFVLRTRDAGFLTIINPVVIDQMNLIVSREGCISEPGIDVEIKRPRSVRLSWMTDEGGEWHRREGTFTKKIKGSSVPAGAIARHEYDHLMGITLSTHVEAGTATVIQKQEAA